MRIRILAPINTTYVELDRLPALLVAIEDTVIDPAAATATFSLFLADDDSEKLAHAAAAVIVGTSAVDADGVTRFDFQLRYDWAALDLDTPGVYYFRFRVAVAGSFVHFPATNEMTLKVEQHGPP